MKLRRILARADRRCEPGLVVVRAVARGSCCPSRRCRARRRARRMGRRHRPRSRPRCCGSRGRSGCSHCFAPRPWGLTLLRVVAPLARRARGGSTVFGAGGGAASLAVASTFVAAVFALVGAGRASRGQRARLRRRGARSRCASRRRCCSARSRSRSCSCRRGHRVRAAAPRRRPHSRSASSRSSSACRSPRSSSRARCTRCRGAGSCRAGRRRVVDPLTLARPGADAARADRSAATARRGRAAGTRRARPPARHPSGQRRDRAARTAIVVRPPPGPHRRRACSNATRVRHRRASAPTRCSR